MLDEMAPDEMCPWCDAGQYAAVYDGTLARIRCGYCAGTGRHDVWTAHPEYVRQQQAPPRPPDQPRGQESER